MRINFLSFIMSVLAGSVLIIFIFFFTKNKRLNKRIGITSIVLLYILSVFRVLIPVDFSSSISLEIPFFYDEVITRLNQPVLNSDHNRYQASEGTFTYFDLFFLLLVAVGLILILKHTYTYLKFVRNMSKCSNLATKRENRIFMQEVQKISFKRKPKFMVLDAQIVPMTYGVIKPVVVLPCNEYTDEELSYIIKHELTHQKNHDTLLKLLIALYCCIFWWNPFSYLLRHDLSRRLELKCDARTTCDLTESEKLVYLSVIIKTIKMSSSADKTLAYESAFVSSEFVAMNKSAQIKERFDYVLNTKPKRSMGKLFNFFLIFICLLIFVLSYTFLLVPSGAEPPDSELWSSGVTSVADAENSYVLITSDGSYFFCFENLEPVEISAEDVENGLYDCYPIKYEE